MKTHFENLLLNIPNLVSLKTLDVGSGKGNFLIEAKQKGVDIVGVELNQSYISETIKRAKEKGVLVDVRHGVAENLPFTDKSFNFVNVCEVIEHVEVPDKLLTEVHRVLVSGGRAYLSIPNRFGFFDPHFHLYLINWLPRSLAHLIIGLLGKHKDYSGPVGRQSILYMHYYTFCGIRKILRKRGFKVIDIRWRKIHERLNWPIRPIVILIYIVAREIYFNSFHLILVKE
jgi:ubiquinone/menaquinone biosynthesis C-methylase UbiE